MRILFLISVLMLTTSCGRSCGDMWEDTKTAVRYMGRGFRTMAGKHDESHGYSRKDFAYSGEDDFVPLADDDLYSQIVMGDADALNKIDADTPIPQSRAQPGERGIPGIEGFMDPGQASIFSHIHFDTDKYAVRSGTDQQHVREIANYLSSHPDIMVFVEGHCDERGPAAYNLALGARRSNAVRNALIREGVDLDRVLTVSYGKERPLVEGHDAQTWKINRRAQFKIYKRT